MSYFKIFYSYVFDDGGSNRLIYRTEEQEVTAHVQHHLH